MANADPPNLTRFVAAQARTFDAALAELRAGRKRSHWMWFVFPQMRGLGHSLMAEHYGLSGLAEACAYIAHPTLGPRLHEATKAACVHVSSSAHSIFGSPDDLKFRSSMTLFAAADSKTEAPFEEALRLFFDGEPDRRTLALLGL